MRRILAVTVLLWTAYASAQTTTAVLVGRVTSADTPLAGALVTITSPALQGARTAETSMHGTYTFPAVPPGTYRVTFAMSGLQTVVKSAELQLAETTRVDADLQAILTEEITVTPAPRAGLETQQISSNVAQEFVNILPIGRAITDIARIAPGVHDSGPGRRLTIHGAQSTDNLWLVNGVVITEARRNQPQNLFIEDAIQETTVLTAGVSAEYGRFLGGVINVLTKSGGNEPSGSIRDSISSDAWTARLPNDPEPLDKLNHDFEGTFGGRILRDRLWFFGAGRYAERRVRRQTTATLIPYVTGTDERRWEAKLTANLGASQTLIGSYLDVDAITLNAAATPPGDTRNLYDQLAPHSLLAAHYSAIFSTATVVEAHYTQKRYYLTAGASDTSLTGGTMIQDPYVNGVSLWAPPFCNVCGDNYRNNRDAMVKATLFLSRPRWGSHSIVAGVNDFHELSRDESKQSGSDFIVTTPTVLGDDGVLYPQMIPGESSIEWYPILLPSEGDDFGTRSAFLNDRVDLGSHFTFNLGIRFDASRGRDQLGGQQAKDTRWSPRLGAIWDIGGNGRDRISTSFSRYAAKVDQFVAKAAAPAGEPALYSWIYDGPEINTGSTLVSTPEVLQQVFDWFESVGGVENEDYLQFIENGAGFSIEGKLKAPVMDEIVVGYARQFGSSAYVRADVVRRRWSDFYTSRVTTETGKVSAGTIDVDRTVLENSDAGLQRKYDGLTLQGMWKRGEFVIGGNYTLSQLRGNVEQETAGGGTTAIQSPVAYYPEYTSFANYTPKGPLSGDERHRGNVWAAYTLQSTLGRFTASALQTYHSGRRYHAAATIDVRKYVDNPGYAQPLFPMYFFTPRGSLRLDDIASTDVALNFSRVIGPVEAFLETDVINVFNRRGAEVPAGVSLIVRTSRNDRNLVPFNPWTDTPIECPRGVSTASPECKGKANYALHAQFGMPNVRDNYQTPRTFRVSVGFRF